MEMPDDFWNYLVNPILGYYDGRKRGTTDKTHID